MADEDDIVAVSSDSDEEDAVVSSGGKKRKRGAGSSKARKRSPRPSLPAPPPVPAIEEVDSDATVDDEETDVKPTVKREPELAEDVIIGSKALSSDEDEPPFWPSIYNLKAKAESKPVVLPPPVEEDDDSSELEENAFYKPPPKKPKVKREPVDAILPPPVVSTSGSQSQSQPSPYPKSQSTHLPNFPITSAEMDKARDLPLCKNKIGQVTYLRACIIRFLRPYQVRLLN